MNGCLQVFIVTTPKKDQTDIILSKYGDFINWVNVKRKQGFYLWIAALWFEVSTNSLKDKLVGFEKLFARQKFIFFFSIWKEIFFSPFPKTSKDILSQINDMSPSLTID